MPGDFTSSPKTDPAPRQEAKAPASLPEVDFRVVSSRVKSPWAAPLSDEAEAARQILHAFVQMHARDPHHGWMLTHALVGLGLDSKLADDTLIVDQLVGHFGQLVRIGQDEGLVMPRALGGQPVDSHFALTLRILTEFGIAPTRRFKVGDASVSAGTMYRTLLYDVWLDQGKFSPAVTSFNDSPWALAAIAVWAPPHLAWTAQGGHAENIDHLTDAVVHKLVEETDFLSKARAQNTAFRKRGQGIFAYSCGGAHLLQGAAMAVAQGAGSAESRAAVIAQGELAAWRFPRELEIIDQAIKSAPQLLVVLLSQRLKTIGHYLETVHYLAALGLIQGDGALLKKSAQQAQEALVATVGTLAGVGILDKAAELRLQNEQVFLDLVGDSAHALHALDLARGTATLPAPVAISTP